MLHHLENPQAGLEALTQVLEPNGAMGIVVYGKYGRTKIYQTQAMLAKLTEGMTNSQKITAARHFLIEHPDSLDRDLYESALGDESELYDMLLHEHDQPFTVDSLYTRLGQAGLRMVDFVDVRFGSRFAYDPRQYLSEQEYNQRTAGLRHIGRQALAERLSGSIRLHSFHATATGRPDTIARSDDPAMIPSYSFGITHELRNRLTELFVNREKGAITPVRIINGKDVVLPLGPDVSAMFRYLDGNRTSGEIFSLAEAETGMGKPKLQRKLSRVLDLLRGAGWITLRHESLLPYTTAENIQGAQLERQDALDAKIVIIDNVAEAVRRALDDY